jgi:ribosomal protein L37AE/L43A
MKSLSGVNRLPEERFECHDCEREFTDDEVRDTWKCPLCEAYIHIYAEDAETHTKIVLVRKAAQEIQVDDLVHLPGMLTKKPYLVLGVNQLRGQLGIGLKEYGQYKVSPDAPVNCRVGAW